jgi:hypothetical protein
MFLITYFAFGAKISRIDYFKNLLFQGYFEDRDKKIILLSEAGQFPMEFTMIFSTSTQLIQLNLKIT